MVMQNEIKKCPNSKRKTALLYCQYLNADVSIHVKAVEKHLHYTIIYYTGMSICKIIQKAKYY